MQFEPTELELFFSLLLKPLLPQPLLIEICNSGKSLCSVLPEVSSSIAIDNLLLKRRNGFVHVVEEVFVTFDMARMEPILDLLLKIVVLILESCMRNINGERGEGRNGDTMDVDNPSDDLEVYLIICFVTIIMFLFRTWEYCIGGYVTVLIMIGLLLAGFVHYLVSRLLFWQAIVHFFFFSFLFICVFVFFLFVYFSSGSVI